MGLCWFFDTLNELQSYLGVDHFSPSSNWTEVRDTGSHGTFCGPRSTPRWPSLSQTVQLLNSKESWPVCVYLSGKIQPQRSTTCESANTEERPSWKSCEKGKDEGTVVSVSFHKVGSAWRAAHIQGSFIFCTSPRKGRSSQRNRRGGEARSLRTRLRCRSQRDPST